MHEAQREAYIAGIYRNVQRKRVATGARELELRETPDEDLGLEIAALTQTVQHKLGIEHNHPHVGRGPQSRFAHRVGHRRAEAEAGKGEDTAARPEAPAKLLQPGEDF